MAQSGDRIVRALRRSGIDVDVVHLRRTARRRPDEPRPARREGGYDLDLPLGADPEDALHRGWLAVSELASRAEPTHVVAFGGITPLLAAPVWAAWLDRPLVTLLRGNDLHTGVFSVRRRPVLIDALARSAAVCVVSTDDAVKVRALVPGAASMVVPNGIALDDWTVLASDRDKARRWREATVAPGRRVVGVIGQLKAKKGVVLLLDALRRSAVTDRFHVVLVGDLDPEVGLWLEDHPQVAATRLPFLDRYELLSLLPACDVVALPSFYDGMPNVALEALAVGVPLVCSTAGGLGDLVTAGDIGWSFRPGDEAGCRAALHEVAAAPHDELARRGAAGAAVVARDHTVEVERDGYRRTLDATRR
jgi:glycosyltransferase involved in cell wall biosynthesis